MKKIFIFLCSFIIILIILELSIRGFGAYSNFFHQSPKKFKHVKNTILCIGNSHTAGAGVDPQFAYPQVLEKMFKNTLVINKGLGNANTSVLLDAINDQIIDYRPNLVVIMTGEPNIWSWYGFSRFLNFKKNNQSFTFPFIEYLVENIRVIRFIKFLFKQKINSTQLDKYNADEKLMYWKSYIEIPTNPIRQDAALEESKTIENYILKNDLKKIKNGRDFYFLNYLILRDYLKDWDRAIEFLHQSIILNNQFDILSYNEVNKILSEPRIQITAPQRSKLVELKIISSKNKINDELISKIMTKYPFGDLSSLSTKELILANNLLPSSSNFSLGLILRMQKEKVITDNEVVDKLMESIELAGPFSQQISDLLDLLRAYRNDKHNPTLNKKIDVFFAKLDQSYPNISEELKNTNNKELLDWIAFDLNKIIDQLQQKNVNILIQNYHWLRGNPLGDAINETVQKVAQARNVPFSDTHSYFINSIKESKRNENDFFSSRYGIKDNHPSILGHKIIAEKLFLDINNFDLIKD